MEDYNKTFLELIQATKTHEKYRSKECVNLIASEGLKSPAVSEILALSHDLESRYAEGENDLEGFVETRYYQGQKYITKIENHTVELIKRLFDCDWVDSRLVSGTHANLATFKGLSLATKNNRMVVAPLSSGAHISHDYTGLAGMVIGLETINLAFDIEKMNIDPDKSATIIRAARPGIVTFGGSLFLFPHPLKELRDVIREVGAHIVYDAAHVLGLIAGREFQDPLKEGADFVTASTHKTFPGPQGGLVLANRNDETKDRDIQKVQYSIFPLTTSNTHLGRLPALGITALELRTFGRDLAKQTVKNAQIAGEYLFEQGLSVLGETQGFTRSHQIIIDVRQYGGGKRVSENLELANIIVNKNLLPFDNQQHKENPSGIRIGFQDVTRRGFVESDIKYLCSLMLSIIKEEREPHLVRPKILALRQEFSSIKYGFQSIAETIDYAKLV